MAVIEQNRTWTKVDERLATETNPVLRRNLEMLREHMIGEATLDLDRVMSTVSQQAEYHAFGSTGPMAHLYGPAQVRSFYEAFAASGAHKLQLAIDRLVVDEHCIVTEGVMRMAYPGRTLALMGKPIDDPDAYYLFETHMAIMWPIGPDGLFIGEDSYTGGDGFAGIEDRKLDPADIIGLDGEA